MCAYVNVNACMCVSIYVCLHINTPTHTWVVSVHCADVFTCAHPFVVTDPHCQLTWLEKRLRDDHSTTLGVSEGTSGEDELHGETPLGCGRCHPLDWEPDRTEGEEKEGPLCRLALSASWLL